MPPKDIDNNSIPLETATSSTGPTPSPDVEKNLDIPPNSPTSSTSHPTGKKLALIMIAVMLGLFLVVLDRTIIATAIPQITNEFNSLNDIGWYASSYLITSCSMQLILGRFYTFYSSKTMYLGSIALFELGSVICGAAPSSKAFIIGRAIAGVGSAGVQNCGMILIKDTVPLGKRPMFMGMMGGIFGIASIIGPLLGGAFTDSKATWRWCFYLNLPVGAITIIILAFILHFPPTEKVPYKQQLAQLDPLGSLFFLPSIICLLLALQWGGTTYAWSSPRIIALLVLSFVLLSAFTAVQLYKQETATIRPSLLANRTLYLCLPFSFFMGGCMIAAIYLLPLYFQAILNVSAIQSGIRTLPLVLSLVLASIFSGVLISKFGCYNPFLILCTILATIGAGLLTTLQTTSSAKQWIGYQLLLGLGLGLGLQQATLAVQAALQPKDAAMGISLLFFAQTLGGSISISISQAIFTNKLVENLSSVPGLDPMLVLNSGATNLQKVVPKQILEQVLRVYNAALTKGLLVAVCAAAVTVFSTVAMPWINVKGLKEGGGAELAKREKKERPDETNAVVN